MSIRLVMVLATVSAVNCNVFDLFDLWHRLDIPQKTPGSQTVQTDSQTARSQSIQDAVKRNLVSKHVRTTLTSVMKKLISNFKEKLNVNKINETQSLTLTSDILPEHLQQLVAEFHSTQTGGKKDEFINNEIEKITEYLKQELPIAVKLKLTGILFRLRQKLVKEERRHQD